MRSIRSVFSSNDVGSSKPPSHASAVLSQSLVNEQTRSTFFQCWAKTHFLPFEDLLKNKRDSLKIYLKHQIAFVAVFSAFPIYLNYLKSGSDEGHDVLETINLVSAALGGLSLGALVMTGLYLRQMNTLFERYEVSRNGLFSHADGATEALDRDDFGERQEGDINNWFPFCPC